MKKECPECGAAMMSYRHNLNKNLMTALYSLFRAGNYRKMPLKLDDLPLTRNQKDNFQKLRYWGLVEKSYDLFGHRMQGRWNITNLGIGFIEQGVAIPNVVVTYRGDVSHYDGKHVTFQEKAPLYYQQRQEYARDAEPFGR